MAVAVRGGAERLELFWERHDLAWAALGLVAAVPAAIPAHVLTPHEVYVNGYKVNPPQWSRWAG